MHRDHVPAIPPSCHLLGSTSVSPNQGFIRLYPSSTTTTPSPESDIPPNPSPTQIHILTLQGHPEFTSNIVSHIIDARSKAGVFSPEVEKEARRRAGLNHDGQGLLGRAIWRVLGVGA